MGKKSKKYCSTSSSSSTSSSYDSSNTHGSCCKNYPSCKGFCSSSSSTYKCAPIYYPNNCVSRPTYPYGQCPPGPCPPGPCPPFPCPPFPCPPTPQCNPAYTVNQIIGSQPSQLSPTSPTVNIYTTGTTTVLLPPIISLTNCNYTKMFVISNIGTGPITITTTSPDLLTNNTGTLPINTSITLYAVYIPGSTSYWVCN